MRSDGVGCRFARGFSGWGERGAAGLGVSEVAPEGDEREGAEAVTSGGCPRRPVEDGRVQFGGDQLGHMQHIDHPAYRRFEITAVEGHKHVQAQQGEQGEDQEGRGGMLINMIRTPAVAQFVEPLVLDGLTVVAHVPHALGRGP